MTVRKDITSCCARPDKAIVIKPQSPAVKQSEYPKRLSLKGANIPRAERVNSVEEAICARLCVKSVSLFQGKI
jgi:hypothetical protein